MQNIVHATVDVDSDLAEDLIKAKKLVTYLEEENIEQADLIIRDIGQSREKDLFHNLGKLTRDLHEAMNEIDGDAQLSNIMNKGMPEARHSLSHVIALTEDAANTTLNAIENSTGLIDNLNKQAAYLKGIKQERVAKLSKESQLSYIEEELEGFIDQVITDTKVINKNMSDIVVAQGYQDVSGQLIQRVSKTVHDVEHSLVDILKINSQINRDINSSDLEEDNNNAGYGPSVPGITNGEVMKNQDEVDDLLSTLGF